MFYNIDDSTDDFTIIHPWSTMGQGEIGLDALKLCRGKIKKHTDNSPLGNYEYLNLFVKAINESWS